MTIPARLFAVMMATILFGVLAAPAWAQISLLAPSELITAVGAGDVDKVKSLLIHGGKPDSTDIEGTSVLIFAIKADNPDMVAALLAGGAHVGMPDKQSNTPLIWAADVGDAVVVRQPRSTKKISKA